MSQPPKIRKLDETVVNRIAAGEIIQRPANALKELLENSLDAKSSQIQVTVKDGGLKVLQIKDNGTGIRREDLEIVCERFTTSKLKEFDDLRTIDTFGFRGEALASISHVAQLTITTKTCTDKCAYKASYLDGKLKSQPQPCAGNQGTIILVENLFYNIATRRKALSSPSDEFNKISEVVTRYAVHNPTVSFSLNKQGESASSVRTPHNSTHVNNVKMLYGTSVSKELIDIQDQSSKYNFKFHALVTNTKYTSKRMTFLLFINHRLVESSRIKKNLEDLYSVYLPKKSHPWCYLSLEIVPKNVDVNVHPTKCEVRFLHEDAIIEQVKLAINDKLAGSSNSGDFYVQSKLLSAPEKVENVSETKDQKKVNPKDMVRTDSSDQKLDKFNFTQTKLDTSEINTPNMEIDRPEPVFDFPEKSLEAEKPVLTFKSFSQNPIKSETKLLSILQLRSEVEDSYDENLKKILSDSVFVGCVDETYVLIQSGVNLYMCKIINLFKELLYEIMLYDFSNYGVMKFTEPVSLYDLAMEGLESEEAGWTEEDGKKEELAARVQELILEKADMLKEYFSIYVDKNGNLKSLPILLNNYFPDPGRIPMFILRLSTEVDWMAEKPCFRDICKETAEFYSKIDATDENWKFNVEHIIYPAIKESLLPPCSFYKDSTILKVSSLPELYKVFERC